MLLHRWGVYWALERMMISKSIEQQTQDNLCCFFLIFNRDGLLTSRGSSVGPGLWFAPGGWGLKSALSNWGHMGFTRLPSGPVGITNTLRYQEKNRDGLLDGSFESVRICAFFPCQQNWLLFLSGNVTELTADWICWKFNMFSPCTFLLRRQQSLKRSILHL